MKLTIALHLAFFFILSCKNERGCFVKATAAQYLSDGNLVVSRKVNGKIVELRDKPNETIPGGKLRFDSEECLQEYLFLSSRSDTSFLEQYTRQGEIVKTSGSPLVDLKSWNGSGDSLHILLRFYNLNRVYQSVKIQREASSDLTLGLRKDSSFAFLENCECVLKTQMGRTKIRIVAVFHTCESDTMLQLNRNLVILRDSNIRLQL